MTLLQLAPEVADALREGRPVVALESTLITHGLPYPTNVETALEMERAVRDGGAVPATVAVMRGQITVGIGDAGVRQLADAKAVRKCSRRDLPLAMALGEDGATTVAGTMMIACMAGVRVFATGGIGGVHRGHPFDVSADITELGRTPIAVVCSGAKAILDLPLTLEALETQGVPVIGYGTDTLPAFYWRASGLPIDARVDTPAQAAKIIAAAERLGTSNGLVFAVPVPQQDALSSTDGEQAIARAVALAEEAGISGKETTPFVLDQVKTLTDGASMHANIALLVNNARTAGHIAAAYAEHMQTTSAAGPFPTGTS